MNHQISEGNLAVARCPITGATAVEAARKPEPDKLRTARPESAPQSDPGVFYDPLSYSAYDNPYDLYKILRHKAPVYYNERRDLWVISRYEDVAAGLANHELLSNSLGNDMDGTHASYGPGNLIMTDDPRHASLRSAVRRVFVGRALLEKEDGLRLLTEKLLDQVHESGGGDFTEAVAIPLAIAASSKLIGVPQADGPVLHEHLLRSMARVVGEYCIPEDAARSNVEAEEHLAEVFAQRQASIAAGDKVPASEATTMIIQGVKAGKVEDSEQVGLAHLLLSAGIDAPAALMTNLAVMLDRFPEMRQHLRENPEKVPAFVEETLRFASPAQNLCRQTLGEVVIGGVRIPADSRVMFLLGSANRDEQVFENADIFEIDRIKDAEHPILTFGNGIHECMGSPFVKMIGKLLVQAMVERPQLRVVGIPERWAKQMVWGFASLPVKSIGQEG